MYNVSSAYTGVPGRQQAPHDVQTSEGQAERLAQHPDILIMAPQGPQRITLQVSQVSIRIEHFRSLQIRIRLRIRIWIQGFDD
jgi:hypothetical protein